MRRTLLGSIFVVLSSALLSSCGGGGAASPGPVGGPVAVLPSTGTFYAGVEYTFTAAGGRAPYVLSSSEPSLLPVPTNVSGHSFTVIPANTAVVDTGLPPEALPIRTAIITIRDANGTIANSGNLSIAQNFLTGYSLFTASNCVSSGTGAAPSFCAGGETVVGIRAAISGNLYGNREYRFEVVRGPISFVNVGPNGPVAASGTLGPGGATWTTRTDHTGDAYAIVRVNNNVQSQTAVIRVVDTASGASTQYVLNIVGVPISGALTAIPDEFTLVGRDSATCGTGTGDFLVFDGLPPYRATSSFPSALLVDPEVSNTNPGRFRFSASNPFFCMEPGTIVITDANNRRVEVTVTTETGEGDPPPGPILFTPGQLVLSCGGSGSSIISGGGDTFSAASPDGRIAVSVADRTVTITRLAVDPAGTPASPTPGTPNPTSFAVNVTDGSSVATISVNAPSNCPP